MSEEVLEGFKQTDFSHFFIFTACLHIALRDTQTFENIMQTIAENYLRGSELFSALAMNVIECMTSNILDNQSTNVTNLYVEELRTLLYA